MQGEDFAKLAKAHSADLASSANGGSLGWISKDMLVPEFSAQMEKLAPNEISEPLKPRLAGISSKCRIVKPKPLTNNPNEQKQKS